MSPILKPGEYLPPVYEVKVTLKSREDLRGYCRGRPDYETLGNWLHLMVDRPYNGKIIVKTEEIAYILYRPRRETK